MKMENFLSQVVMKARLKKRNHLLNNHNILSRSNYKRMNLISKMNKKVNKMKKLKLTKMFTTINNTRASYNK